MQLQAAETAPRAAGNPLLSMALQALRAAVGCARRGERREPHSCTSAALELAVAPMRDAWRAPRAVEIALRTAGGCVLQGEEREPFRGRPRFGQQAALAVEQPWGLAPRPLAVSWVVKKTAACDREV